MEKKLSLTAVPLRTVVPEAPPGKSFNKKDETELNWGYLMGEKEWPYVGSLEWQNVFKEGSRKYYNSLAVFPYNSETHMHGIVGLFKNGSRKWQASPPPPPISKYPGGKEEALKNGGFYMNLSDSLPLDREPVDGRDEVCLHIVYDVPNLPDVTVIITFYNEALSTLLRSIHSVLNRTPSPLLTEIILVDDHGNIAENLPGGPLDDYVRSLPKTKILRLPERRGLVWARLAGAKIAKGQVVVVLDSHIECNDGWLEPQLARLVESPKSIVFPQIMALNSEDFSYLNQQGIGCFLTFKWAMQEKASLTGPVSRPDAIASPSMAGGLFAVYRSWFWEIGGYDEEFSMWGAENVEMGFRTWMCGGRMECTPCARVYHIYRKGGHAYSSPPEALWKNRLRTARIWTDEFYQIAEKFNHHPGFDIGNLDNMLELKERLHCKNFTWFLKNVDPNRGIASLDEIVISGELKSQLHNTCVDTLSHSRPGDSWGVFGCHGSGGTQGFLMMNTSGQIRCFSDEFRCLGSDFTLTDCNNHSNDSHWVIRGNTIEWHRNAAEPSCLTFLPDSTQKQKLKLLPCNPGDARQGWSHQNFSKDDDFALPTFSPAYRARKKKEREEAALEVPAETKAVPLPEEVKENIEREISEEEQREFKERQQQMERTETIQLERTDTIQPPKP